MLNKLLVTAALVAALLSATAGAATPLPDFKATYELKRGALKIGNSTIELISDSNGAYTYKSHSWPVRWAAWLFKDKLHETSRGTMTDAGVRPDFYHYQRTGGAKEREAKLVFDWERMVVENNVEDSPWEMSIPAGTIDKLVSQLAMMYALANGQEDITFNIADGGKLKEFRFKVVGEETLELPAGSFETVKVTRLRDDNKRETYIWCAPALNYLPVRIWQREKDDSRYQSDLESVSDSLRIADVN